jgi:uncharacterized DUF497 family protein
MEVAFDPDKSAENIRVRGLSFEKVAEFDFNTALYYPDNRRDYGEMRIPALGRLDNRVHALVFTNAEKNIRVIRFRRAREVKRYEQKTQSCSRLFPVLADFLSGDNASENVPDTLMGKPSV